MIFFNFFLNDCHRPPGLGFVFKKKNQFMKRLVTCEVLTSLRSSGEVQKIWPSSTLSQATAFGSCLCLLCWRTSGNYFLPRRLGSIKKKINIKLVSSISVSPQSVNYLCLRPM